ncbi:hypothetical protein [Thalassobaculum litoreum]|uniref:Uncharacterized protein n=1 Tax=Thalassobaculum litoreum DSM 18839 TaxID=1123362 RepID=A0A8G2BI85_9PROT|nr:hypothetical protein [Thalassobaculum litoreum]SDF84513.1 hypothetical protein SAMN05660686_02514 [Thalassobaculum litoreum DSM 18839]
MTDIARDLRHLDKSLPPPTLRTPEVMERWLDDITERHQAAAEEIDRLRTVAAQQGTHILRLRLALKIAAAFGFQADGFDGRVSIDLRKWWNAGGTTPIPWPDNAFFEAWAKENGLSNVDGDVGYRFTVDLSDADEAPAKGGGNEC